MLMQSICMTSVKVSQIFFVSFHPGLNIPLDSFLYILVFVEDECFHEIVE